MADLNQPLIGQNDSVLLVDRIFCQAYQYFKVCNFIFLTYSLVKIASLPLFIWGSNSSSLMIWFICIFFISVLQFINYRRVRKASCQKQLFYRVAERVGHLQSVPSLQLSPQIRNAQIRVHRIYDFTNPDDQTENQRSMKVIAMEIKYHVQREELSVFYASRAHFLVYQIFHIWGLFILFGQDIPNGICKTYMAILLFLSTYQFLEFYLLMVFMIIVLPFYYMRKAIVSVRARIRWYKLQRAMISVPFSEKLKGDHQCSICWQEYKANDQIIVLKCSQLHHFHAQCFREWVKNKVTCPLCRRDITTL